VCAFIRKVFLTFWGMSDAAIDRRGRVGVDSTVGDGTTVAPAQGGPVATSGGELASWVLGSVYVS
jgi:hypothetical protein